MRKRKVRKKQRIEGKMREQWKMGENSVIKGKVSGKK